MRSQQEKDSIELAQDTVVIACAQGVSSPAPPPRPAPKLLPYLFVLRDVYAKGPEVELQNRLFHPDGNVVFGAKDAPPDDTESILTIEDEKGAVVYREPGAFLGITPLSKFPEWKGKASFMLSSYKKLPELPSGRYRAAWTVGGTRSNDAPFEIRPGHEIAETPLVRLDKIPKTHGLAELEEQFLVRITANQGKGLSSMGCYHNPIELDGKAVERPVFSWAGSTGIGAGWSWMYTFDLDEFAAFGEKKLPLSPGRHRLRVQCEKQWSNEIVF